ncbi:PepSY domain-containing protein [Sphingomicrobium lutaoense]|uniref:PepSY-associated TM region n=1 Tax=Sphingomicrobium lutaoense TaxID=515949 RepID=A0A839YZJ8_9SPHN|nr:PepSY domain-containing protein [Sphingomicrobium lutaoense]MBB3764549.1 hypothetical protein [Sphingomicrobium lutaoense]
MKMESSIKARKSVFTHILWRKIHKWVGLILGLQFVLWSISGAVMALLDAEKVGGHAAPAPAPAISMDETAGPVGSLGSVEAISFRQLADRPVYELTAQGETKVVDARTLEPVEIDKGLAERVAREAFGHETALVSVDRLEKANLEARGHGGPIWRLDFADEENSSSYVSATTGRPLVNRGDTWRTFDFVWMLHNMDYVNRTSFNHPLIIFVAFGTLWLAFTGFYLLFKSFRRREFNWILGRKRTR